MSSINYLITKDPTREKLWLGSMIARKMVGAFVIDALSMVRRNALLTISGMYADHLLQGLTHGMSLAPRFCHSSCKSRLTLVPVIYPDQADIPALNICNRSTF